MTELQVPYRRCALLGCMFLTVASFGFLEPFVPLYLQQSGLAPGQMGIVSGVGAGLALLVQPLLGRLSDRLDRRRPLMLAAALFIGGAYFLYRSASSLWHFVLLAAVAFNGIMYLNTACATLIGRISQSGGGEGAASAYASFRMWGSVGYVAVSLLAGWYLGGVGTLTRASLQPVFLYGPLVFVVVAALVPFVPDPRKDEVSSGTPPSEAEDEEEGEYWSCERNMKRFVRAYFLYAFAWTGAAAYLSIYFRSLGASPVWITRIFAVGVLCEALVMRQAGRLSDRYGRRPLLALAFAAMPVRLLLYAAATGPLWVMGVQALHGINFGIMGVVAVAFVNDLCREEDRGAAQSRMAAAGGAASALGPLAGGWISDRLGIRWNFGIMAGVSAAAVGVFLWKVRESLSEATPLYERGPACLRPALRFACIPLVRLRERAVARREWRAGQAAPKVEEAAGDQAA